MTINDKQARLSCLDGLLSGGHAVFELRPYPTSTGDLCYIMTQTSQPASNGDFIATGTLAYVKGSPNGGWYIGNCTATITQVSGVVTWRVVDDKNAVVSEGHGSGSTIVVTAGPGKATVPA